MKNQKRSHIRWEKIYEAYNFLNVELFSGHLPFADLRVEPCSGDYAYFQAVADNSKDPSTEEEFCEWLAQESVCDTGPIRKIVLNSELFTNHTDKAILAILVHEMLHLWQEIYGKPLRGHHNRQWAGKMKAIGLAPTNLYWPNLETGKFVGHRIIENGLYAKAFRKLKARGFKLRT